MNYKKKSTNNKTYSLDNSITSMIMNYINDTKKLTDLAKQNNLSANIGNYAQQLLFMNYANKLNQTFSDGNNPGMHQTYQKASEMLSSVYKKQLNSGSEGMLFPMSSMQSKISSLDDLKYKKKSGINKLDYDLAA